jgi:hypothetical protein
VVAVHDQPPRGFAQRAMEVVFKMLPKELC